MKNAGSDKNTIEVKKTGNFISCNMLNYFITTDRTDFMIIP